MFKRPIKILIIAVLVLLFCYTSIDGVKLLVNNRVEGEDVAPVTLVDTLRGDDAEKAVAKRKKGKGNKRKKEMPAALHGIPERIIERIGYTVSFNREHNNPNYVAWELTAEESTGNVPRSNNFVPDPDLPAPHQVTTNDYKGFGYDRGHMAPAADMKWSYDAMRECFYMSNICPQNHTLNAGGWQTLEEACRRWAKQEGAVYIVCGPIYRGTRHKKIGKEHIVTVPEGFFKVVLSLRKGKEKAIGFYYANNDSRQSMAKAAMSVDAVEELTGMNFFVNVSDDIEDRVEATYSLKDWH